MKRGVDFVLAEPLPPFIARVYYMALQPQNQNCISLQDGRAIVIQDMQVFSRGPLFKTFPGMSQEQFTHKLVNDYKFMIDKTYMNSSGIMFRLPKTATAPVIPSLNLKVDTDCSQSKPIQKPQSKPNFSKPPTKTITKPQAVPPSISKISKSSRPSQVSAQTMNDDQAKKLAAYRKFVGQKIYQIQEQLIKVRNKYPDKSAELSGLFKYTTKIMEIANEDPFKTS